MTTTITVPAYESVSPANQVLFDQMKKAFGKVPNLYATLALHPTALGDYLRLQNRNTTLSAKEREIVNLLVSQVNECQYCIPAHTAIGRLVGFTEEEMIAIRKGVFPGNKRYNALAVFVHEMAVTRGKASAEAYAAFRAAGYDESSLIDVCMLIGDKIISNYLHNSTQVPVDWPPAPGL